MIGNSPSVTGRPGTEGGSLNELPGSFSGSRSGSAGKPFHFKTPRKHILAITVFESTNKYLQIYIDHNLQQSIQEQHVAKHMHSDSTLLH